MTIQQVIGLAVRLAAIGLFTKVLSALSMASQVESAGAGFYFVALMYALMAVYLWLFPMSVAHRLLPKTTRTDKIITNSNQLAVAGVTLVGLWLFATLVPNWVYQFQLAFLNSSATGDSVFQTLTSTSESKANWVANSVELALALFMMLRARPIARFLTA